MIAAPTEDMSIDEYDLLASIVKEDFFEFVREFWSEVSTEKPVWNWHIPYLCDELSKIAERVFKGESKEYDLIINIPPGTTKSTVCSIMFPAWVWTRMPHAKFICASNTHDLVLDHSRKCRDIVMSEKYMKCFPEIKLRSDQNTKGHFANTKKGSRQGFTVSGKNPVGFHAHFLIVDDPLDAKKALSELEVKAANNFMNETLPSRKINKDVTPTLLIMQRLHQNDPTGNRLERKDTSPVKHICLPAEESHKIRPARLAKKYIDGLLDPIRLNKKVLKEQEAELGQYGYSGQYRQNPVPLGGGMFKTDRLILEEAADLKSFKKLVRYWDKAGTAGGGAYTVGALLGVDRANNIWILDIVRGQWESSEREQIIVATAKRDTIRVQIGLEQEPGSGGLESAQATIRRLRGFRVKAFKPTGDKALRADPFSVEVNSGIVRILRGEWNQKLIDEMTFFPFSTYKDQVDAMSGAFGMIAKPKMILGAGV